MAGFFKAPGLVGFGIGLVAPRLLSAIPRPAIARSFPRTILKSAIKCCLAAKDLTTSMASRTTGGLGRLVEEARAERKALTPAPGAAVAPGSAGTATAEEHPRSAAERSERKDEEKEESRRRKETKDAAVEAENGEGARHHLPSGSNQRS